MVKRSGVPVDVIMECSNGEMALEVIKEQEIDVMFTDIRMPKMDGIELVRRMQECDHIPLTVAISGYDDFSYAVEMLRNGVREYILKPIERERITEILKKLEEELNASHEKERSLKQLGYQQMKHMMLLEDTTEDDVRTLEQQYEKEFYEGNYAVCCANPKVRAGMQTRNYIYLENIDGSDIFVVEEGALELLLKNELNGGYAGVSLFHRGLGELRTAYREALLMRKRAFCRNVPLARMEEEDVHVPEKLVEEAKKLTGSSARLQRVQLIGTDRKEELVKVWKQFFYEVENGRITPEEYETCMVEFLGDVAKTYRSVLEEDDTLLAELRELFREDCLREYEDGLFAFIVGLHEKINSQLDVNRNSQKMQQAVAYIEENYAKDLNMAVVSNYISMNYSLFSYSFKQYTGSNFVNYLKDIRMRQAKRLLAETDLKIAEISQNVGYDNEKHFMKMFKASCGVSPSEYRKNMRQE